ncbi:MAG: hypothetical protein EOO88_39390 [Pedobacter sp.]|nr:MAG: hypothetical protein EOO88_39390 [Pedobacter sp.]
MATVTTFAKAQNLLGESPFWNQDRLSVFWVEIEEGILHEKKLLINIALSRDVFPNQINSKALTATRYGTRAVSNITE